MSHTDHGTLHAYLAGELSAREAVELERHVAACSDCRRRLDEARALLKWAGRRLARSAPPDRPLPPPAAPRPQALWSRAWFPLAAGAAAVLVAGAAWYGIRGRPGQARSEHQPLGERAPEAWRAGRSAPSPSSFVAAPLRAAPPTSSAPGATGLAPAPFSTAIGGDTTHPTAAPPVTDRLVPQAAPAGAAVPRSPPTPPAPPAPSEPGPLGGAWLDIGFDAAGRMLGQPPLAIPALRIRRVARPPTPAAVVLVEQVVDSATVIRLYEARQPAAGLDTVRERTPDTTPPARLTQDVGVLRIAIEGPLTTDSLRRLLTLLK